MAGGPRHVHPGAAAAGRRVPGAQPAGPGAAWVDSPSYKTFPFPPDGAMHLRYKYTVSNNGKTLTLQAQGTFIGIPNWTYTQTFQDGQAPLPATEVPSL